MLFHPKRRSPNLNNFVCILMFSKPVFTHISVTKCSILMGFLATCSLCDVVSDHVENSNLNVSNFRLILLEHITNVDAGNNHCFRRTQFLP